MAPIATRGTANASLLLGRLVKPTAARLASNSTAPAYKATKDPFPAQLLKTPQLRSAIQGSVETHATPTNAALPKSADVVIVGGGVTGSSLLYELAEFTDLNRVVLLERRRELARVASGPNNNSQTIHCGDIETNYTPAKADIVQKMANRLRNFATKLPPSERDLTVAKMQKMAIGVGDKESAYMENRYRDFKPVFKKLELLNKNQIAEIEPAVVYSNMAKRTLRKEDVVANFVADDHAAVDYFHLTNNLVKIACQPRKGKDFRALIGAEMLNIERAGRGWRVNTNNGTIDAKFVVVASCGYSLLTAHRLGYARHLSCLPVAGSFYFGPKILNGKVYCVQNPLLPFAAVHGDPDLVAGLRTRFGPTALPLPLLERYNWKTFLDFCRVVRPSVSLLKVYWDLWTDPTIRRYMLKNILFEVPYVNDRIFLNDVRKIVPSLRLEDLKYAHGFGGVRPQLIDKNQKKLLLGEGKISPENETIIFNVTPSPGGTTCLGNAETDMRKIVSLLGCNLDEQNLKKTLLDGEYPVEA